MQTVEVRGRRRSRRRWWLLLALLAVGATVVWALTRGPSIEPGTVLLMDLQAPVPERSEDGIVALLSPPSTDFVGLFRALELGAKDPRIVALVVKIAPGHVGPGKVEELRNLLERFRRASGKPIVAHVSAPDTLGYFLATAADEILLDKSTTLDTVGIRLSAFFLKDALAKLGVELDLVRVGQYKGAFEELTLPGPTPAFEESMNSLADSIYMTIVEGIAKARKLGLEVVSAALDRSPLPPGDALSAKLVDQLVEGEEILAWARARAPGAAHVARVTEYLEAEKGARTAGVLAVVHVLGTIVEGETRQLPVVGFNTGAATAVEALRGAANDPDVAGILLRIDSPGGIVSASEKIYQAVAEARKKKPVIASMGGAAASGGYYAACGAERILAHAMTFTGSLGVFGGKIVIQDLLRDHEVNVRTYPRGKRANLSDPTRTYSAEERLALRALLEDSYHRLIDRVAKARKRSFEEIDIVSQGRVWTGSAAAGNGLVDGIGGLADAVDALRDLGRLTAGPPPELRLFPPPASWWDALRGPSAGKLTSAGGGKVGLAELAAEDLSGLLSDLGLSGRFSGLALMPFALAIR